MKATGSRETEEPRAFKNDDSHDESFRKEQELSVVELMPPNHGKFKDDKYVAYGTEKVKRESKTPSESTNDSKDRNNKKRKIGSSNSKKRAESPVRKRRDNLDKARMDLVAELINTTDREKQMVLVDDIVVLSKHLQCLTHRNVAEAGVWLGHKVRYLTN